jgi:hypothetical protein
MSRTRDKQQQRRLHSSRAYNDDLARGECAACDEPAIGWAKIVGPTGVVTDFDVCHRHLRMAGQKFDRLCAHIHTKERFLADPDAERARMDKRRSHR